MNFQGWCPIISSRGSEGESLSKCTTSECAWWDKEEDCCIVFSIKKSIRKITYNESTDLQDVVNAISSIG